MEDEGTLSQTPDPATCCPDQPHECSSRSRIQTPKDQCKRHAPNYSEILYVFSCLHAYH